MKPGPRIRAGESVEVRHAITGGWMLGKVVAVWANVDIPSGRFYISYDVDGNDDDGPWHGTWDDMHIRIAAVQPRGQDSRESGILGKK